MRVTTVIKPFRVAEVDSLQCKGERSASYFQIVVAFEVNVDIFFLGFLQVKNTIAHDSLSIVIQFMHYRINIFIYALR